MHQIKKINWPSNSSNLNSIENLLKIIKDLLRYHNKLKNKQKIIQIIQEVWTQISQEKFQRFILNMLARIQAIIEAKDRSNG